MIEENKLLKHKIDAFSVYTFSRFQLETSPLDDTNKSYNGKRRSVRRLYEFAFKHL